MTTNIGKDEGVDEYVGKDEEGVWRAQSTMRRKNDRIKGCRAETMETVLTTYGGGNWIH